MNYEVIITCAVTGSGDTAEKHPDLPKSPDQIAAAAIEAAEAGVAVTHIHVRDPKTGEAGQKLEWYQYANADGCTGHDTWRECKGWPGR